MNDAERKYREYKQNVIQKDQILQLLESKKDVSKIETNGYWYHFKYKNYYISFVNQEVRICVDVCWYAQREKLNDFPDYDDDEGNRVMDPVVGYKSYIFEGDSIFGLFNLFERL